MITICCILIGIVLNSRVQGNIDLAKYVKMICGNKLIAEGPFIDCFQNGSTCVNLANWMDCIADCPNGIDEHCSIYAWQCDKCKCIPPAKILDGTKDCVDGTDEDRTKIDECFFGKKLCHLDTICTDGPGLIAQCSSAMVVDSMATSNGTSISNADCIMSVSEQKIDKNKAIVTHFYDMIYNQKQIEEAYEKYVTEPFIQHRPNVADGIAAAVQADKLSMSPESRVIVNQIIADESYVSLHVHLVPKANDRGTAVFEIYRIEDGKIVEHWDVVQGVPEQSANAHPMF